MTQSSSSSAEPLVYFVDDEPNILSALQRTVAGEPYRIRTFTDPNELLQALAHERPAVVVSDFYMPQMKGAELLARVAQIDSRIVRVILTGKPDLPVVVAAATAGAVYRFMIKPWDNDEFRMSLRNAVGHYRLMSERDSLLDIVKSAGLEREREALRRDAQIHLGRVVSRKTAE